MNDMHAPLLLALLLTSALDDNKAFKEGITLYQDLEFEQAIFRFEEAALAADLSDNEKATVFSWMAMSYAGIGQAEGAKRSLKNALLKDADVVLPQFAPPKVKEWMAEVKAEMPTTSETPAATGDASETAASETSAGEHNQAGNEDEDGTVNDRAPTESVEEFTLRPEQPDESGGGGSIIGGILMMGGGAGALVIGAVAAVPAAIFFFDALFLIQPTLDDIGPNHQDYALYKEAQTNDYIIGGVLAAVGVVFAALGLGLVVVGAGTATYGLVE